MQKIWWVDTQALFAFRLPDKPVNAVPDDWEQMSDEDLVVIPLPTNSGSVTYAIARLVSEGGQTFAEAIVAIPGTVFAPPRRIALSTYSIAQIRPGSSHRPSLYLYEGMILPPP